MVTTFLNFTSDLTQDLGLIQTVQDLTRGNNILDFFFTNNINLITKTSVISGVSDHQAVTIESKLFIKQKKAFTKSNPTLGKVDKTKIKLAAKNFNYLFKYIHNTQAFRPISSITVLSKASI